MRSNTNVLMSKLDASAPSHARLASTPNSIIGGAIMSVRSAVYPASRQPEPLSCSKT